MIRIAICDDERGTLDELSALLERYRLERGCEMQYAAYHSPLELMAGIERGQRWDILLLDIMMPGENGMELAREIRAGDAHAKIIFLSASPEYAVESYAVGAYYYQLKPVREDSLFSLLDRAVEICFKDQDENLVLKSKTGIAAVAPAKLEYCEAMGRSLLLHLRDGKLLEVRGKLEELEAKLRPVGFLRVHRSYLVNMACIQGVSYRAVTLVGGMEISIPHGKYNAIKEAYLSYAFERGRVLL